MAEGNSSMTVNARLEALRNTSPEQALQHVSRVLPAWITGLLVVVIAWQLAEVTWMLFDSVETEGGNIMISRGPPGNDAANAPQVDIQSIVDAHLFGEASAEAVVARDIDTSNIDITKLNLKLRGTIAEQSARDGLAIIADNTGKEQVYAVGDAIPGGVKLHSVHADRVILNRGGTLEALPLPREFSNTPAPATRTVANRTARSRTATTSVRQALSQNAAQLTNILRPVPYSPGGQQKGYRVYPGRDRQKFAALGLRPGDIVTDINGTALDDPNSGMRVFGSLGDTDQVQVTVERNGQSQVLVLNTSQIQQDPQARQ